MMVPLLGEQVLSASQPHLLCQAFIQRQNPGFPSSPALGAASEWAPNRGGGTGKNQTPICPKDMLAQTTEQFIPISTHNHPPSKKGCRFCTYLGFYLLQFRLSSLTTIDFLVIVLVVIIHLAHLLCFLYAIVPPLSHFLSSGSYINIF